MPFKMMLVRLLERINYEGNGEITVFLSLVLLLILALVGTILEAARVNTARTYADRALEMALDSVFTEYGRSLYDEYHVFFLENKEEGVTSYVEQLSEFMEYTFQPAKDLTLPGTNMELPNTNFWGITTNKTECLEEIYATDYKGTIFMNEAINYMKYRTGTDQLEKLLNHMNLMDGTSETSAVVEEKLKVEESLGELNQYIIKVIQCTEGISFSKNGIRYENSGLLKTESNFIKQLCPTSISSSSLGINNNLVWNSLKNKYINPVQLLNGMQNDITVIKQNEESTLSLNEEIKQLSSQIDDADEDSEREAIVSAIESIQESICELEDEISARIKSITDSKKIISEVSLAMIQKIDDVYRVLPKIKQKQSSLVSEVEGFENTLNQSKEDMIQDVYSGMQDDLSYMKQYVGKESSESDDSMVFRIQQMKPILESNRSILEDCSSLRNFTLSGRGTNWDMLSSEIATQIASFTQYQVKQLTFDYSSLKPKSDVQSPISSLGTLLSNGVMELVVKDTSKISDKAISLPNNLYLLNQETASSDDDNQKEDADYGNELINSEEQGYGGDITNSFGDYSDSSNFKENVTENGNQLGEMLLWSEYIQAHFKDYITKEHDFKNSTALEYEREYILSAKGSDKENLQSVITKLVMTRTILNFIYILGDREKRDIAYATAAALVGYTCLEPLVRITQVLILLTWSFEEALVDTGAILSGRSMPLCKDRSSFLMKYNELFLMSKSFIQTKIKKIPEKGKSGMYLGYEEYLKLFLFMEGKEKQAYRTMDLIQENLRLHYRKNFDISKCIYGIRISSEWEVPSKFIRWGFVYSLLKQQKKGWIIGCQKDYSY